MTAPIVFAGAICKQILADKGIHIYSHVLSIKDVKDDHFSVDITDEQLEELANKEFSVLSDEKFEKMRKMRELILEARKNRNSVGGKIECMIKGVPAGIGSPFFDSLESRMSTLFFSIPAVKSVSFGDLDDITQYYGSEANDAYYYDGEIVKTKTNHNGGIIGGITNGMPILFTLGIKPTSSIALEQDTINVATHENTKLAIVGRHDPCIAMRAPSVVEAMAAIAIMDEVNV